ncbi:MAG: glycine C-acetyltransferase [Candidatus Handelsmanbacteria bacterium RIFCSPLOWO2_12_FULL_64_10]|uniref:2-amino-3-ketobutyrate coenzyme A ligase n=1 Tax=Handelsmanbacteria sp. (strain RIFCSPLOWO2_12_FULL_64_10) TaxID=1817868 RepID=A0A1F6CZY9_HANXR|nr:MAG: glycine C-acetyltransferase [Candidatus Handelsmanbacteria bacterium RIFCSPLOWO2_12_FULL_64_10]
MAYERFREHLLRELRSISEAGLRKTEREITSPQGPVVSTPSGDMLNFCANNYLGLASHPEIVAAAAEGLRTHGFGLASVRFICGTQDVHRRLERRISAFLGTEETILYTSCFDANAGLFETLLGPEDAVLSDALNHASIIDGVRLCKATRHVYRHADLADLGEKLKAAKDARFRLIATDGVFSMHGDLAPLPGLCDLADRHDALLMVDDSHATGFFGPTGRGTPEHLGVSGRIDILTSTLGKALGGASGGFTASRREIVDLLRQRSRPYLFSNSVAPPIVCAALRGLDLISERPDLLRRLADNTRRFRSEMTARGFAIREGIHPIVPIMTGDEGRTVDMARALNDRGIFVVGFSYPVVPRGEARIRVQISAAHTPEQLDRAIGAFTEVGREQGLIG